MDFFDLETTIPSYGDLCAAIVETINDQIGKNPKPYMSPVGQKQTLGDVRFNSDDIQRLYDSNGYPRRRRMRKSS
jgi:hypothetical protein